MVLEFDPVRDFELALVLAPELGSAGISRILTRASLSGASREAFFRMSSAGLQESYGLKKEAASALSSGAKKLQEAIAQYKARTLGKPMRLLTLESATYPKRIEEFCTRPPGFLFAYGNLQALASKTFCVLASRDAGPNALEALEKRVEEGVLDSNVLVTGANTPAYQRGAVVPLRWGAPRVLVLDRGIFACLGNSLDQEPFPAARLWRYRFDPETDLVLSSFRPDDQVPPGGRRTTSSRDEQVVALSDEVHIVHQSKGGNTDKLSARAESLGRAVIRA